jgi:uncharacterized membrane protein
VKTRNWRSFVYLTAGLGLIVSIYAGLETVDAALRSSCSLTSYFSCGAVDSSGKTSTLGIPDAAIGIAGFILIIAVAALAERNSRDLRYLYVLLFFTTGGVAFASYFAYLEVAVIHALCPVCTAAYFFGIVTWVGSIGLTLKVRRRLERTGAAPSPSGTG